MLYNIHEPIKTKKNRFKTHIIDPKIGFIPWLKSLKPKYLNKPLVMRAQTM